MFGLAMQALCSVQPSADNCVYSMGVNVYAIEGHLHSSQGEQVILNNLPDWGLRRTNSHQSVYACRLLFLADCRWMWVLPGSVPWQPSFLFLQTSTMPCRQAALLIHCV